MCLFVERIYRANRRIGVSTSKSSGNSRRLFQIKAHEKIQLSPLKILCTNIKHLTLKVLNLIVFVIRLGTHGKIQLLTLKESLYQI